MNRHTLTAPLLACAISLAARGGAAADWPQILGPQRDGHAVGESLQPWDEPPQLLWRVDCGAGYAGVAVADDRVLLWHRVGESELLDCLAVDDGSRLWRAEFPAVYRGGVDPDRGPRAVPLVADDRVFAYGAAGDLHAVALADGETLWSRQLGTDYQAADGYFGAGSTPLIAGDLLVVALGGRQGAGIVAVNAADGKTRWQATDEQASYASPVTIQLDNAPLVAVVMSLNTVVLDPSNGQLVRRFAFGRRGPVVNAATPLVDGPRLLVTASYGIGCRMVDLASDPPSDLWGSREVISSQYATPVRIGQWLYGISGREDMQDAGLRCIGWHDGQLAWRQDDYGTAHLIAVGQNLLAQKTEGRLELLAADPQQYRRLASSKLPPGSYRSLPALSDGVVYCRRSISATEGELLALRP